MNKFKTNIVKIPSIGGRMAVKDLSKTVKIAMKHGIDTAWFSARQEVLLVVPSELKLTVFKNELHEQQIHSIESTTRNIVTSLPASGIFPTRPWLHSGKYTNIVESFTYAPTLTISLVDPRQDFVPVMDSELNFIASDKDGYWYLYLCLGEAMKPPLLWPVLIDSKSIASLSKQIESAVLSGKTAAQVVEQLGSSNVFQTAPYTQIPAPIEQNHPQYDGFFRIGDVFWLGIYNVGQRMPLHKLAHLLSVCVTQNLDYIELSTWGSIVIKDLKRNTLNEWNQYLGLNNLNIGPAYSELNWKLDPFDQAHHGLKNKVNQALQQAGLRTWGLSLGVASETRRIRPSILIKMSEPKWWKRTTYALYHAKNFNPVNGEYVMFDERMGQDELIKNVKSLIGQYQRQLRFKTAPINLNRPTLKAVHQCSICQTQYLPKYGDPTQNVAIGTAFSDLSDDYHCPVCEGDKAGIVVVNV